MNNKLKVLFVASVIVIAICGIFVVAYNRGSDMNTRNRRITASEAREMMKRNPNAIILDVRTTREFETGRIPGAVLLPDYAIRERAGNVLPNQNALILVYCASGMRSREAVYELISMGYTNVYDFGGLNTWPYERD